MGQNNQLDLGIIGGNKLVSFFGLKGGADFSAFIPSDRNVLQVRVPAGKPPRGCSRLDKARVNPAMRVGKLCQRVGIGRF